MNAPSYTEPMNTATAPAEPNQRRHRTRNAAVDDSRAACSREVVLGILLGVIAIGTSGLAAAIFDWLEGWAGVLIGWAVVASIIWIAVQYARRPSRQASRQITRSSC